MAEKIMKRSILLPKIRETRRALLKSVFGGELVVNINIIVYRNVYYFLSLYLQPYELKTYEFFTIALLYQLNISHVFFFIGMAIRYGASKYNIQIMASSH